MGLWEAVGSLESNQKIHLRTGQAEIKLRSYALLYVHGHTPNILVIQNPTS